MNTKLKKGIFWGVMITSMILVINVLHYLLGGHGTYGGRREKFGRGPEGMGHYGGFEHQHFMNGPHHEGGFPWIILFIGLAVLILVVRWLRRRAKTASMKQFIDTPLMGSHTPVINQNATVLDQWEKNLTNKKENE